ncbi:MAG: UDP-N-acetylmuramoyl-tripeptide--D-alanyl-D-alanine ligase, partial [Streptomycetales bacterium]
PVGVPAIVVDAAAPGVVDALGRLARAVADRLPATTLVGVTGSSGKTGTKDLLAQVLSGQGPTVAPQGSYNNEIGLPLTVLRAEAGTRHLILEMGARGAGHIRYLCRIAPPRIGVVLNVGTAHLGEFGSREGIAASKGELVEALPAGGLAVLNADDPLALAMAGRSRARVVTFGCSPRADVAAGDITLDRLGRATFTMSTPEGSGSVRLLLHGAHQVCNALAAACVARELGMSVDQVADALGRARALSPWRMEVTERPDGVTVVNDAYNANPDSMRAALQALTAMAHGRRTWAVLGEMRELGEASADAHVALGREAARLGVARLIVVGDAAAGVCEGTRREGRGSAQPVFVPDAEAAAALLESETMPGDVVLVKASRAAGLERVAEALLAGWSGGPEVSP